MCAGPASARPCTVIVPEHADGRNCKTDTSTARTRRADALSMGAHDEPFKVIRKAWVTLDRVPNPESQIPRNQAPCHGGRWALGFGLWVQSAMYPSRARTRSPGFFSTTRIERHSGSCGSTGLAA